MKNISDEDVLKASNELYQQIAAETNPVRKDTCKYFGKHSKRYCLATSHRTCKHCNFYEPTIFVKFRTLLKNTVKLKHMVETLTADKESLELKIKMYEGRLSGNNDELGE